MKYNIFLYIIIIIIIGIFIRLNTKNIIINNDDYNLIDNGFVVIKSIFNNDDIKIINDYWNDKNYKKLKEYVNNHDNIKLNIFDKMPGYIFQDYIFLIEKSKINTCHRDGNSMAYNSTQKFPSYTILFYIDDMEYNLDVIPNSHKNTTMDLYITDTTKSIQCNKGDAILFDAALVHSGSFNKTKNNKRIQMKITHKDDIESLNFYEKYNKILDKDITKSEYISKIEKYFSCQFPFISDLVNSEIKSDNQSYLKKLYSKIFYNNENFYKLPDII